MAKKASPEGKEGKEPEELSKIALAKLKRREKEEEEGLIKDETKKHYVKDTKKEAKTAKHIKPRAPPPKSVIRGSLMPKGIRTPRASMTPRSSKALPRGSKVGKMSRMEGKEAAKIEEIKRASVKYSLSWPGAELEKDKMEELEAEFEDKYLTAAKLRQMRADLKRRAFINAMLRSGVDGIAELIRTHAIPKCIKVKFVAQPFEPTPRAWWQNETCTFAFNHPMIRSRLERLMGSNLVRLTDREYMLQLHDRILEDYIESMNKRIAEREARERQREKDLVLKGTIPLDRAPRGMDYHPILLINTYCQKLIDERRAKIKVPKVVIPLYLYLDDTPDPPCDPGLSIRDGHVYRGPEDELCIPPETHVVSSDTEDIENGYMFKPTDYEKVKKYESPPVQKLAEAKNVEEMYLLADQIIGPLKTIKKVADDESEAAPSIASTKSQKSS